MLAGPGVTGLEILTEQGRLINEAAGASSEVTAMNTRIQNALAEIVRDEADPDVAAPLMKAAMQAEFDGLSAELKAAAGEGLSESVIDQTIQQLNTPWFRFFFEYDPRPALESMTAPVLSLIGGKDLQVPYQQNMPEIEAAFSRSGHPDATVRMLPGLNHLFQESETGSPSEYQNIEQTFSPEALDIVSSWIRERFSGTSISDR
jgi:pimeloyl-ACP methyl ester carboxylesterase